MAFSNDIVAGSTLVRPAIRSPNYVSGVSGWTINRDGTSEFASGTFRGAVVVIDPNTGNVLASIGANGNGSFQYVYATNDVIIGSVSVLNAITHQAQGVQSFYRTTSWPNVPASTLTDIVWIGWTVDTTRQYKFCADPIFLNNTNSINSENFQTNLILKQGSTSTTLYSINPLIDVGAQIWFQNFLIPGGSLVSGPATLKLQMSNNSSSTAYPFVMDSSRGAAIWVEDIGPALAGGNGGTGSPTGSQQFTTTYTATASQVYDSNFSSESDPNNLYIGQLSGRTHGSNENSLWCFNGSQIRSDLTGATVQSAKLYQYCTNSSSAAGSTWLAWMTNTTPPSTITSGGFGGANYLNVWPVPGWGFIDITSQVSTNLISNAANAAYLQKTGLTGSCSWYGAGTSNFAPYIQITYTK